MAAPDNVPHFEAPRPDLKPISITQPEGASFTVKGHHVAWQKWSVRVGFTPREGLVLHEVAYAGRPIIYRASLAEMFVPYGDPAPTHRFKNVFDQGEYGVGWLANSLTLGCDCVGEIFYFDGVVNDQDGEPATIENAICMHEEDYGIGWKHTDFRTEDVEVRRLRRLVISSIATVGNYEYGYFWYLYTDGTIEYEVKLTGVISTGALEPGARPAHGTLVAPGLYGPHHQHFFCVRLDMAVDGNTNTVVQVDSEPLPYGPENPDRHGLGDQADGVRGRVGARPGRPAARAVLADREPGVPRTSSATPSPTSSSRARTWRRCSSRSRASPSGPGSPPSTCGSRRTTRASASPRATTRTSTPAGTASRATPPRAATPRPRTWCSGTRSAPTTWSGPRTGR